MFQAAEELRFEYAAKLRDEIKEMRRELDRARAEAPARMSAGLRPRDPRLGVHHGRAGALRDPRPGPDADLADDRDRPRSARSSARSSASAISNDNGYVVSFLSFGIAIALVAGVPPLRAEAADLRAGRAARSPSAGSASSEQRERLQKLGIDPDALRPDPSAARARAARGDAAGAAPRRPARRRRARERKLDARLTRRTRAERLSRRMIDASSDSSSSA